MLIGEKQINESMQFIYEHFISFTILVSFFLYFMWNLTRYVFEIFLTPNQESIAIALQEFFNSVLITLLLVFFITSIQRREFSYFERLSLMNNGIIKTTGTPEHKILYTNQQVIELLKLAPDEILQRNLQDLYSSEDQIQLEKFLADPTIPTIKNVEIDLLTSDGKTTTPVLLSISRIYSVFSKKEKELFIVIQDIKNLKETQNRLKYKMQLEKESVLNSLVQKVGHEINNPLTFLLYDSERMIEYVKEMTSMLKIYDAVEKEIEDDRSNVKETLLKIEKIKKEMNYDSAITDLDEILDATKEGIQRIAKVVKEVRAIQFQEKEKYRQSLNTIIRLTVDLAKENYIQEDSNIVIKTNLDMNIPSIPLKAGEIGQSILHLLINSIQALENKKGEKLIKIETKLSEKVANDIDQNKLILLCIEDNGEGIKKENLQKIFDPYFTTKPEGTGLGLSVVKQVIEEHNGNLEIKSESGKGTKIILKFPAY